MEDYIKAYIYMHAHMLMGTFNNMFKYTQAV